MNYGYGIYSNGWYIFSRRSFTENDDSPKNNITIKVDGGNLDEKKRETNLEPKRSRRDTYNKLGSLLLIIGVACGLIAAFFNYYEE